MFIAKYAVLYQMGREIQIIANCRLPIADLPLTESHVPNNQIGNWQSAIGNSVGARSGVAREHCGADWSAVESELCSNDFRRVKTWLKCTELNFVNDRIED